MAVIASGSLTERYSGWFPLTYEVAVNVTGGQIVVADAANPGKVKVAPNHSPVWLGMAKYIGKPGTEFDEQGPFIQNIPGNSPKPRLVACPHVGCYDVINAGTTTLNPGEPVEVVGGQGGLGNDGAMVGGRAVVGTVLGHVTAKSANYGAHGYKLEPTPVGQRFRVRLGRA